MQQLKLDGMDSLLSTTEQAKILGILKDNDVSTETSRQSNMMTYYALGVISVLAVGVLSLIHI